MGKPQHLFISGSRTKKLKSVMLGISGEEMFGKRLNFSRRR